MHHVTVMTCVSPFFIIYSLASVTPPAEMAKVASFSGMSGLKERIKVTSEWENVVPLSIQIKVQETGNSERHGKSH